MQLSLFDNQENNKEGLPYPLLVSEKWDFDLNYHDIDGKPIHYLYHAVQWVAGLGAKSKGAWTQIKKRFEPEIYRLPYKTSDNKTYQVEFIGEADCLKVAQHMKLHSPTITWEQLLKLDPPDRSGYIYIIGMREQVGIFKIGITVHSGKRLIQLNCDNPFDNYYELTIKSGNYRKIEAIIHNEWSENRKGGEWFYLNSNELKAVKTQIESLASIHHVTGKPLLQSQNKI